MVSFTMVSLDGRSKPKTMAAAHGVPPSERAHVITQHPNDEGHSRGTACQKTDQNRKLWSEEAMESALKEVTECKLSVRRAALQYGLPKPRLHDQVSGRVIPGVKLGAPWYLDKEE